MHIMNLQVHACSMYQSAFQTIRDTGVVLFMLTAMYGQMILAPQSYSSCKVQLLFICFQISREDLLNVCGYKMLS